MSRTLKDFEESHSPLARREREKLNDTIKTLEAEAKKLESNLSISDDLRRGIFGLKDQDLGAPKWLDPIKPGNGKHLALPHLLISDEQVGEDIAAAEVEGVNHYDHNVYAERHDMCARKAVEISTEYMKGHRFPGIIIGFLGDAVNGEIHAELAETNSLQSVPSAAFVVRKRRDAIDFWLKHFERVFVIVIPGNHGRTTIKPRFKRYAAMNYETLIGWWLQSIYENNPRVKIVVPQSGDYWMPLWGRGLFWTHGDRLGGLTGKGSGMGFAGPALPIIRGSKNIREQQTEMGRRIDYIHIGHWHTRLEVAGTFANGAMAGYNEYAHGLRYRPAPAEQWLYFLHPERGAIAYWPIFLSDPVRAKAPEEFPAWITGKAA